MMESLCEWIDASNPSMLAMLERLVNTDSGADNPQGIQQVARIAGHTLQDAGFTVEYVETPGVCTHLLARKRGRGDRPVLIIGHLDTVFARGTAAERPFSVQGDKASGPGVLDMKGGITIALFALAALHRFGWDEKDITVFLCGDEETAHAHTNAPELFTREAGGKAAVFNMESGMPDGSLIVSRKGACFPQIEVRGIAAHSGKDPQRGASAILELAHKVVSIHGLTDHATGVTYNVGLISGGRAQNIVADSATAKVDVRFVTRRQGTEAVAALHDLCNQVFVPGTSTTITNDRIQFWPMERTQGSQRLFDLVRLQGRNLGIPDLKAVSVGGSSDSCWTVQAGAPTVCGMGARGDFNHSEREYIVVGSLTERVKLLAMSIMAV